MAARKRGVRVVQPFGFGCGGFFGIDFHYVAVVQLGIKRHHFAVYFGGKDMVADVGVYRVGKVDRR